LRRSSWRKCAKRAAAQKEALLSTHRDALAQATILDRVQQNLARREATILELEASLRAARREIDSLEATLEMAGEFAPEAPPELRPGIARERDPQTLLVEREAFIEESENTLFHRAQELQELELHLQQWQELLNVRARELGLLDEAPEALLVPHDPAQDERLAP
jgi:chromosome segregation ATPase